MSGCYARLIISAFALTASALLSIASGDAHRQIDSFGDRRLEMLRRVLSIEKNESKR